MRNISYDQDLTSDISKEKKLRIAILTEQQDIKMIEMLFMNEVNIQGNVGEAICSFKVISYSLFFMYTF